MTNLRLNLGNSDNQSSVVENWETNSIQDLNETQSTMVLKPLAV